MLEAIAVVRDLVIICSAVTVAVAMVLVARVVLRLSRRLDDVRGAVVGAATIVLNPIRGVRLILSRRRGA